jgi:hypothetical protein
MAVKHCIRTENLNLDVPDNLKVILDQYLTELGVNWVRTAIHDVVVSPPGIMITWVRTTSSDVDGRQEVTAQIWFVYTEFQTRLADVTVRKTLNMIRQVIRKDETCNGRCVGIVPDGIQDERTPVIWSNDQVLDGGVVTVTYEHYDKRFWS